MKLAFLLRSMALVILATWMVDSCSSVEEPEAVAINFLNACRDGDKKTIARLSIAEKNLSVLKWRRLGAEYHRDDQGMVSVFLKDLETYREGKERLFELAREHQRLFGQKPPLDRKAFSERERTLIDERDSLLMKLEHLKARHAGMFYLLDAGILPQILEGKRIQDFSGPYDIKIYFYFTEISSVSPHEVRIQHHVKIELTKVSLGDLETDWLIYRINDLTE